MQSLGGFAIRSEGLCSTAVVCRDSLLFQVKVDMVPSTHPVTNKADGPPNADLPAAVNADISVELTEGL